MSIRTEKVASVVKRTLTKPISELAQSHSCGLVTITSVRMSKDLQIAKVYMSIFGGKISPGEFIELLERNSGSLRHYIGSNLRLRFTPELKFFLDDTLDQMEHIQNILVQTKTKKTDNELLEKLKKND